jgi:hypothetical protein
LRSGRKLALGDDAVGVEQSDTAERLLDDSAVPVEVVDRVAYVYARRPSTLPVRSFNATDSRLRPHRAVTDRAQVMRAAPERSPLRKPDRR